MLTLSFSKSSLSPFHNTDSMIEERSMTMEYINRTRSGHRVLTWLTLVVLAGCAPTLVDTVQEYSRKSPLRMTDRVLVYDFEVSANEIKFNSAIGARLANLVAGATV